MEQGILDRLAKASRPLKIISAWFAWVWGRGVGEPIQPNGRENPDLGQFIRR